MVSRNPYLLAMIALVFCMIFVKVTQSNPLEKRFDGTGLVVYADFTGVVTGRFTWTNIPGNKCRVTGQFNTGLDNPNVSEYTFHLEDGSGSVIQDLTSDIASQIHINPPGSSPFQCDFPFSLTSVQDVAGLCFVVNYQSHSLGSGGIVGL